MFTWMSRLVLVSAVKWDGCSVLLDVETCLSTHWPTDWLTFRNPELNRGNSELCLSGPKNNSDVKIIQYSVKIHIYIFKQYITIGYGMWWPDLMCCFHKRLANNFNIKWANNISLFIWNKRIARGSRLKTQQKQKMMHYLGIPRTFYFLGIGFAFQRPMKLGDR